MKKENQLIQRSIHPDNSDITTWALSNDAIARFGQGYVHDMAFSPDGKYLAVGSRIGLWWYQLSDLSPIALWETDRGLVSATAFSDDGQLLVTGNWDGDIKVWDVQQANILVRLKIPALTYRKIPVKQVTLSPNKRYLAASGSEDVVYVWSLETGDLIAKFTGIDKKRSGRWSTIIPLSFSPDSQLLASTGFDCNVSVWNVKENKKIAYLTGHTSWIYSICFSPCAQFLATGDQGGTLRVWDVPRGMEYMQSTEYATHRVTTCYLSSGTLMAAGNYENKVVIWNVSRREKFDTFECHGVVHTACFSDCGTQLVVASQRELKVWKANNSSTVSSIHRHTSVPILTAFSPDQKTLMSLGGNTIQLWDVKRKRLRTILEKKNGIHSFVCSSSGKIFAAGIHETTVKVWDIEKSGHPIAEFKKHQKRVYAVAFSPTGKQLVTADIEGNIYIWDVHGCKKLSKLTEHVDWIRSLAFSPDGKQLVTACENKTALLWDVERGTLIISLSLTPPLDANKYKGNYSEVQRRLKSLSKRTNKWVSPFAIETISFSPCGNVIAGGLYSEIRLWSAANHEILYSIQLPRGCQWPFALVFSPCGHYLASGSWYISNMSPKKLSVRLWEVASGENIATFWGHPTDIQSLAFSPDGTLLASGSFDGTILLWDVTPYL